MTDDAALARAQWFEERFASCPVMGVLRGLSPRQTVAMAHAAWDLGVTQVEVPIESESAMPSLRAAIDAGGERGMPVGAGTIVTAGQLRAARSAGAAYAVSPGLDPPLIALAHELALPFLPGVATPSEILLARRMGVVWLKAFPASVLGPGWIRAMTGPFPTVRMVATGGITGDNAAEFLAAGAAVVAVSSAFAHPGQREELHRIIAEARSGAATQD